MIGTTKNAQVEVVSWKLANSILIIYPFDAIFSFKIETWRWDVKTYIRKRGERLRRDFT